MEFRKNTKLSRVAFASEAGIDSSALSSIEHRRSPLRYAIARKICERFGVNQRWLFEGELPISPYIHFAPELENAIPSNALFSNAYLQHLKRGVERQSAWIAAGEKAGIHVEFSPVAPLPMQDYQLTVSKAIAGTLELIPPHLYSELTSDVVSAVVTFHARHKKEIEKFLQSKRGKT
jgi:transcriptional regulator with XRE-family HTH domain